MKDAEIIRSKETSQNAVSQDPSEINGDNLNYHYLVPVVFTLTLLSQSCKSINHQVVPVEMFQARGETLLSVIKN
jgi:hypothetical protein